MKNAIELHHVYKKFNMRSGKNNTLKDKIFNPDPQPSREMWVLRDIHLEVPPGSSLALIGKNGSGKSTLLKLICKILYPTSGEVRINGKISTLLELGAGFHPDFTGRENIFFNGSVLGFTRKQIQSKLDSIIAFSELEPYIDMPVRNYSSGMYMRLGFSVAIHMEPDILLMDEILAVGDFEFQKKCMNEILRLKSEGTTIVFVSHSGDQAQQICDQAIWLEDGQIRLSGTSRDVVAAYEKSSMTHASIPEYNYRMGCRSQQQRDFGQALKYFNGALEHGYNEFSVKILRSSVYLELGMQEEASRDAERCLAIAPPGADYESIVQHARFINSKRGVEMVSSAQTVLFDHSTTKPDFLIIGTQKGGTTSLYHYLTQHPNIKAAAVKEVHYFDHQFDKGFDWYKRHFPPGLSAQALTGEASPYYLFHPQTPGRVRELLPDTKLIVLLRNPVDRAYSHYQMMVRRGLEQLSFPEALLAESARVQDEYERMAQDPGYSSTNCEHFSYLKRGLYAEQLKRWFHYFPPEQFLIMSSERLLQDPAECCQRAWDFLGMRAWGLTEFTQLNEGNYTSGIPAETLKWLYEYFAEPNRQLFDLIGEEYDWSPSERTNSSLGE
ncbi:sulfotransferase domain-containing protein [Paenibacillus oenotherae]|uniref:Sulfotransferase domain-containing protein n=1 Tax=Paenibacillus oenotherae TaxID=1435645 RepID=A0ABS7D7N6_9BACL|nr:sulfotransferase domain-containing protein [Paenibacillus oenotherae]MBW7475542.1 sulfotransferase domain-containing protein [Paenibacillus oenotherae]